MHTWQVYPDSSHTLPYDESLLITGYFYEQ